MPPEEDSLTQLTDRASRVGPQAGAERTRVRKDLKLFVVFDNASEYPHLRNVIRNPRVRCCF